MKQAFPQIVVADAGPLIGLAIIAGLPWLEKLFRKVLIPEAVAAELRLDSNMPGAAALASARNQGWLEVVKVAGIPAHLTCTLDLGEAEAIMLAKRNALPLLIDESRGRIAARSEGLRIFGTGAVLIKAKEQKLIQHILPHLDTLMQAGYRFSAALRHEILRLANEAEPRTRD